MNKPNYKFQNLNFDHQITMAIMSSKIWYGYKNRLHIIMPNYENLGGGRILIKFTIFFRMVIFMLLIIPIHWQRMFFHFLMSFSFFLQKLEVSTIDIFAPSLVLFQGNSPSLMLRYIKNVWWHQAILSCSWF